MLSYIRTGKTYVRPNGYTVTVEKTDATYVFGINGHGRTARIRRSDFVKRFTLAEITPERLSPAELPDDMALSVKEVSVLAGVLPHVVREAAGRGVISGRMLGKEWALSAGSARLWATEQRAQAPESPAAAEVPEPRSADGCGCAELAAGVREALGEMQRLAEDVRGLTAALA